ncbi:ATP-binding protein [Micromonospora sonneratiae]|uniref:ATP/GTP-binding protein n=1 Tax=Micromonospora sonneratiae TaxID=1184706 RepID=A0ABW3YBF6_9ACTN
MLLRFEVSNHRSINEPVELSMIAVDEDRPAARSFDLLNERVLTVAGVYGPNASGKSNVVDALAWLSTAAATSLLAWDEIIPREPFKFDSGPETPSTFEVEMMVERVRHTYRVELDDEKVLFESLHSYPERRPRSLFEREGEKIRFRRELGSLSAIRELLTPTTLALSAAMRFDVPDIRPFGRKLADIGTLGNRPRRSRYDYYPPAKTGSPTTERIFLQGGNGNQLTLFESAETEPLYNPASALSLLRFADLGIDDVHIVKERLYEGDDTRTRRRIRLMHRVADQQISFDMADESEGTRTWFRLIGPTLYALRSGQTLLFDEIDSSLHPRLSAKLLELFQDPNTNPYGAQLIFTSHDTSLLNHLNRDEVWLTEKGADGTTTLTALAEYGGDKVRRSLNLEKAYLQGRFGAVPDLDQHLLRRALGLSPGTE